MKLEFKHVRERFDNLRRVCVSHVITTSNSPTAPANQQQQHSGNGQPSNSKEQKQQQQIKVLADLWTTVVTHSQSFTQNCRWPCKGAGLFRHSGSGALVLSWRSLLTIPKQPEIVGKKAKQKTLSSGRHLQCCMASRFKAVKWTPPAIGSSSSLNNLSIAQGFSPQFSPYLSIRSNKTS
eukprot:4562872-Amphidinium_carterae.1